MTTDSTTEHDGNDTEVVFQRYLNALDSRSVLDHSTWQRSDVEEFTELHALLTPLAEAGEVRCQYALATLYWLGWCYETEEEFYRHYEGNIQIATHWWAAAASQGHWGALDNLIVCGVGEEADHLREESKKFEEQRPDLVGWVDDMPVYWIDFMQERCKHIYGHVITKLA